MSTSVWEKIDWLPFISVTGQEQSGWGLDNAVWSSTVITNTADVYFLCVCVCVSPKSGTIFCPQQRLEDFEGRWLLKLFLADETLCTIYTTFCMQVKTETHAFTDFNTFVYLCVCFLLRFVLSFLIKPATVWLGDFKSSLLVTERTDEKKRGIKKKELEN